MWWFTAEDRVALITAMADLYQRIHPAAHGQQAAASAVALGNWLPDSGYRWIMIVFDNVASPNVVRGLVPSGANGRV